MKIIIIIINNNYKYYNYKYIIKYYKIIKEKLIVKNKRKIEKFINLNDYDCRICLQTMNRSKVS